MGRVKGAVRAFSKNDAENIRLISRTMVGEGRTLKEAADRCAAIIGKPVSASTVGDILSGKHCTQVKPDGYQDTLPIEGIEEPRTATACTPDNDFSGWQAEVVKWVASVCKYGRFGARYGALFASWAIGSDVTARDVRRFMDDFDEGDDMLPEPPRFDPTEKAEQFIDEPDEQDFSDSPGYARIADLYAAASLMCGSITEGALLIITEKLDALCGEMKRIAATTSTESKED